MNTLHSNQLWEQNLAETIPAGSFLESNETSSSINTNTSYRIEWAQNQFKWETSAILNTWNNWFYIIWNTLVINKSIKLNKNWFKSNILGILSDQNIKKIKLLNLDSESKEIINQIISENYPLIEVIRLIPGETVTNITFSWIKKINDTLGQCFTDKILEILQNTIKWNFRKNTANLDWNSRIVRSNYKNLTFSSPEINISEVFFNSQSKNNIINELVQSLNIEIEQISIKNWKNINEIKNIITENLDFSLWESKLETDTSDKDKLRVFYEAEIISRKNLWKKDIISEVFNMRNIKIHAIEASLLEEEIIEKFKEKNFEFNWIEYKAIIKDIDWIYSINPILLRYVRKYADEEKVKPVELNKLTKQYIKELNSWFDFISPSINIEDDIQISQNINESINKWTINSSDLMYTYKWSLSRDAFFQVIKSKIWLNAFVDIKDMWIDNLNDFKRLRDKLIDGKLSEYELLEAGNSITQKFIKTVNDLKNIYEDKVYISLGWDEIYIFIEWISKAEENEILSSLNTVMNNNNLKSRISHNFDDEKINDKIENFDNLDKLTKINKAVEEAIEALTYSTNTHSLLKVPDSISLNIEKWLENLALNKLDDIITSILLKIDDRILEFIRKPIDWKVLHLWEVHWFKIILKWWKNSLMEINIIKN